MTAQEMPDSTDYLRVILEKAERSLEAAHQLAANKGYDFAVSRAYYTVFYAMEAALYTKGVNAGTHNGTIRLFGQEFVKTGIISREIGAFIGTLLQDRQTADYAYYEVITEEKCYFRLEQSRKVLESIKQHLHQSGFLPPTA
ncbi:MAG: HEPN domain-containing protein [Candidatus Kapaibacteriota bacterium]|jgi:uncharacterized protein (UPF0332 family)